MGRERERHGGSQRENKSANTLKSMDMGSVHLVNHRKFMFIKSLKKKKTTPEKIPFLMVYKIRALFVIQPILFTYM